VHCLVCVSDWEYKERILKGFLMNTFILSDLDELALSVRDVRSRAYIFEAISVYRAGAYRAAIISTWIAVAYDTISKIRELANQGDNAAQAYVDKLDKAISGKKVDILQGIERNLLKTAHENYEFLAPHEYTDLQRLYDDRNLCAHPAYIEENELFQPAPELVRAHIVHSIKHLLRQQPVQGRSAIAAFMQELQHPSFPSSIDTVCDYLNTKYLNRAKDSFIKNLVICLLKKVLLEDISQSLSIYDDEETLNALLAVQRKHPEIYKSAFFEKIDSIAARLEDNKLLRIFSLFKTDPSCWSWIGESLKIRIKQLILVNINNNQHRKAISNVLAIPPLKDYYLELFAKLELDDQAKIIIANPAPAFAETAIKLYAGVSNYSWAESLGEAILSMAHDFSDDQIRNSLVAMGQNNQIYGARRSEYIVSQFLDATIDRFAHIADDWKALSLKHYRGSDDDYFYPELQKKLQLIIAQQS
jgi:hypothetical protein